MQLSQMCIQWQFGARQTQQEAAQGSAQYGHPAEGCGYIQYPVRCSMTRSDVTGRVEHR
jgi:hypothetical protein